MGKKSKKPKKEKVNKNKDERLKEVQTIKDKITGLGLSGEVEAINNFYQLLDKFIEDGESCNGKINLIGFKRVINYILTNTGGKKCLVSLEYNERV